MKLPEGDDPGLNRSHTEAGRIESGSSGDFRAALSAGAAALIYVTCHVEAPLCGMEGSVQKVSDIRNVDARDASLITCDASTVDAVCPGEGGVGDIPGESDNLSLKGHAVQGGIVGSRSTRQANREQSIETI